MKKYYYVDGRGKQGGPLLVEQIRNAHLSSDTLVWCEGMSEWTRLSDVKELTSSIPPIPPRTISSTYSAPVAKPDNYLAWAILTTVCCCLPFGVVAIVQATKVENLWNNGEREEAVKCAQSAKMWCLISLGGALLCYMFIFFVTLIGNL